MCLPLLFLSQMFFINERGFHTLACLEQDLFGHVESMIAKVERFWPEEREV